MDVARYITDPYWVSAQRFYSAIIIKGSDGSLRGWLLARTR
jgi:hypothetical protein